MTTPIDPEIADAECTCQSTADLLRAAISGADNPPPCPAHQPQAATQPAPVALNGPEIERIVAAGFASGTTTDNH